MVIDILKVEDGLWVLEEDGKNVLLEDCQEFGVTKAERRELLLFLRKAVRAIRSGENIQELIDCGVLKKLDRQPKALQEDLWELRTDGGGARILFIRIDPKVVVVSAVHKNLGSLNHAVNRGINRWKNFLKTKEKSASRDF